MANFNANTKTVFEMTIEATAALKKTGVAGNASIVNVSSITGLQSFAGVASYCASKAAVDMYTQCAAVDFAPFGVRVNAVNPGVVRTNILTRNGMTDADYEAFLKKSAETTHPLGKALGRVRFDEFMFHLFVCF